MEKEELLIKEWKTYCCRMVSADQNPKGFKEWKEDRERKKNDGKSD